MNQKINIRVTKHAVERLRKRFYFRFPKSCFANHQATVNLILGQLDHAVECPFYVNKVSTEYGLNTCIYKRSGVYFVCQKDHNNLIVLTIVKNWYND